MQKKFWKDKGIAYLQIILGCLIGGAAYPLFLTPNTIAPGGLTGVSMILNHYFGFPIGTTSLILNIPLFILGFRSVGYIFVIRSLFATVLFSVAIDILPLNSMTVDPLLGAVFGGVVLGIGLGMILRGGATTGGTDMAARLVHRKMPSISVGMFLFAIDCIVVIAAGLALGSNEALYALIAIWISSKVIDFVMLGLTSNKACFIMSENWEKINDKLLTDLNRGTTLLRAKGGYTKKEKPVILCVVSRHEVTEVKQIVRNQDENAFVFVTEAHETLGEGFSALDSED